MASQGHHELKLPCCWHHPNSTPTYWHTPLSTSTSWYTSVLNMSWFVDNFYVLHFYYWGYIDRLGLDQVFVSCWETPREIHTLRPRQNGRHFADDIFKCVFLNENVWIPIKISLKFVPKGQINKMPALVQIMAWRRPGDKPLSEPMMIRLPTHICVTRPQWDNGYEFSL